MAKIDPITSTANVTAVTTTAETSLPMLEPYIIWEVIIKLKWD